MATPVVKLSQAPFLGLLLAPFESRFHLLEKRVG
jgi:hypothetical protein